MDIHVTSWMPPAKQTAFGFGALYGFLQIQGTLLTVADRMPSNHSGIIIWQGFYAIGMEQISPVHVKKFLQMHSR